MPRLFSLFPSLIAATVLAAEMTTLTPAIVLAREWQDASGTFKVEAEFVAVDAQSVVLKESNGQLLMLKRVELSAPDQVYLNDQLLAKQASDPLAERRSEKQQNGDATQSPSAWHLRDGDVINGNLAGFGRQELIVRRERGQVWVNNYNLKSLPPAYEKVLPVVVAATDHVQISTSKDLQKHLADGGGGPFEYTVEGLQIELFSGGAITVPIGLLQTHDSEFVAASFQRWKAAHADDVTEKDRNTAASHEQLLLESYQRTRHDDAVRAQQLKQVELGLLSANAGVTNIWEVLLYPNTPYGYPRSVVVPGRTSFYAQQAAMQSFPGWSLGPIRRLN